MDFKILHQRSCSLVELHLQPGEKVKAEARAMVHMSSNFNVETRLESGLLSAIAKKFFGGESLFINVYTALEKEGTLALATNMAGDVSHIVLEGSPLVLQCGAFLASSEGVTIRPMFGGIGTVFSRNGLFFLKASGRGDLFYSTSGIVQPIDINGKYVVGSVHVVAFSEGLSYTTRKVGGWKSVFLSGKGDIMEFTGSGRVWIQSRNIIHRLFSKREMKGSCPV